MFVTSSSLAAGTVGAALPRWRLGRSLGYQYENGHSFIFYYRLESDGLKNSRRDRVPYRTNRRFCSSSPRVVAWGNVMVPGKRAKDRRIQKTQRFLHEALASLIREKAYDSISVKEILDRANVGRSTFYLHFRNKDELLVSSIHDMLRPLQSRGPPPSARRHERIIWFSLPVFEHVHQHRRSGAARMGTRGWVVIHEHLRKVLVELIADDVKRDFQGRRKSASQMSPNLLVQYVASTFILVLNWWVESRSPLPAKEVNDLFRALILPTLAATWDQR
ncbi:MAG: TetR family transcriptional regulator [Rhodospirillales bacterium]|nr:TetR family transcriptional regulator [Rhodospirillales bacterium]